MLNDVERVDLTGWRLLALEAGKMYVPVAMWLLPSSSGN